jgi:hypothetical protein
MEGRGGKKKKKSNKIISLNIARFFGQWQKSNKCAERLSGNEKKRTREVVWLGWLFLFMHKVPQTYFGMGCQAVVNAESSFQGSNV